jgi:hypothetical protein
MSYMTERDNRKLDNAFDGAHIIGVTISKSMRFIIIL